MQSSFPSGLMGRLVALLFACAISSLVTGQTIPDIPPEIVSAWKAAGENALIIFHHDGTYYMAQDTTDVLGMERGTFTWDKATSAFSATTVVDTNGDSGLSHPLGATTVSITGNTMTLTVAGEGSYTLSRVVNTASAIVGSWFIPGERTTITFLADGSYHSIEEEDGAPYGYDGMERGTYTWNSASKVLTAAPITDTNGDIGLSSLPSGGLKCDVVGNAMTVTGDGDTTILRRVTPIPTPLNTDADFIVDKYANHRQTSSAAPTLLTTEDSPFWAGAYIGSDVNGTGGTLKIGNQSSQSFVRDDDSWYLDKEYTSLTTLNATTAFPNGANYVFTRSGGSATLSFPANGAFLTAPGIVDPDGNGDWIGGQYWLGENQTLTWSAFTAYDPATVVTFLTILEQDSDEDPAEAIIQGDVTSYDFSGKLTPNRTYDVQIEHVKMASSTTTGTGPFAGKLGYALYNSNTRFTMVTRREPSSAPVIRQQPQSQSPPANSTVILTVGTQEGDSTQTFQWYRNHKAIPGQTGNSLSIRGFSASEDAGSYHVVITNYGYTVTSVSATLGAPAGGYTTWLPGFFNSAQLADPLISGPNADPDKDGIANLIEFVLGGNPATGQNPSLLPAIALVSNPGGAVPNGEYFRFTYRRVPAAASLNPGMEFSSSLAGTWTPATGAQGVVEVVTPNFYASPTAADRVEVHVPRATHMANGKLFGRLRVTVP